MVRCKILAITRKKKETECNFTLIIPVNLFTTSIVYLLWFTYPKHEKGKTIDFFSKGNQLQNIRYDWFMLPQMTKMKSAKFGFRFKTFQTCR
jgi:hypothetical protein